MADMEKDYSISIIIPAYNESTILARNLKLIEKTVKKISNSYEIIVSEDGSIDGTEKLVQALASENRKILYFHSKERLGKGFALKRAMKASHGDIVIYMDADLAFNLKYLPKLVDPIIKGYDVAIGSRYLKGARLARRSPLREIISRGYNILIRALFQDEIHDHQCGFKAFNRHVVTYILNNVKSNDFFFDTDFLIKAKLRGFSINETPVEWCEPEGRDSKFRLIGDGLRIFIKLFKLRIELGKDGFPIRSP